MTASFEETQRVLQRRKRERETRKREGPGVIDSFVRGFITSPVIENRAAAGEPLPEKPGLEFPSWGDRMPQAQYEALRKERTQRLGERPPSIPAPTRPVTRIAQSVGQDALPILAGAGFAPLLAPAAPMAAVAAEMGLGALGSGVARSIEEAGGSGATQFVGEVAATAAAPLAAPTRVARRIGLESAIRGLDDVAVAAAESAAKRHGFDTETWLRASSELKRKLARGTKDPDKYIDKTREALGRDIEAFGETTPTLAQSAGEYGGQNIASMELQYAKHDQDYAADALGRRLDVAGQLEDDFSAARPSGSMTSAREGVVEKWGERIGDERAKWEELRGRDDTPWVWMTPLKEKVSKMRGGPRASRRYLPTEARFIEQSDYFERLPEWQAIRSELLDAVRAGKAFGADRATRRRGARAAEIVERMNQQLDTMGTEFQKWSPDQAVNSEVYKEALALTRENALLFDPKSEAFDAIINLDDPRKIIARVKNAKRPVAEVERLRTMLADSPEGWEGFRASVWNDLFGSSLGDRSSRQMESALDATHGNRDFYRAVFGDQGLSFIDELVRRQRVSATGKAGTSAQAASTGTGQAAIDQLISYASDAKNPVWSVATKTGKYLANKALSREEVMVLLRNATLDIRLAKALLDTPTARAEPAWRIIMDQSIAKAKREAMLSSARRSLREIGGASVDAE